MATQFTLQWVKNAAGRIGGSQSSREAISTTAGYLTDLHDELIRIRGNEPLVVDYLQFVHEEIKSIESLGDRIEEGHLDLWRAVREVLKFYEQMPTMVEWDIDFTIGKELAGLLDPKLDRDGGVREVLVGLIFYVQGWVEGQRLLIAESWREWELQRLREWPDTTPYDDPPDGMDEFERVGLD